MPVVAGYANGWAELSGSANACSERGAETQQVSGAFRRRWHRVTAVSGTASGLYDPWPCLGARRGSAIRVFVAEATVSPPHHPPTRAPSMRLRSYPPLMPLRIVQFVPKSPSQNDQEVRGRHLPLQL